MNAPLCPVCHKPMTKSDVVNIYFCPRREPKPEENIFHAVMEAALTIDSDGNITSQVIEVPPFIFNIQNDERGQRTIIVQITYFEADGPRPIAIPKDVLDVKAVINLPWHDREEVLRRLKMYLLFS